MDVLLHVGLSNAAVATALAIVAGAASVFWRRRPALVHGLWLLVLLKLLTPPLVRVPIPVPAEPVAAEPEAEWIDAALFASENLDGDDRVADVRAGQNRILVSPVSLRSASPLYNTSPECDIIPSSE